MSIASQEQLFGGIPLPDRPDARHPFIKLLLIWRRHLWLAALVMLAELFKHGPTIASAVVSATLVGLAVVGRPLAELTPWAWALGACVLGQAVATWADMWLAHDLAYRVLAELRATVYRALERLAPAYMIEQRSGDAAMAVMADVERLEWFYAHTIGNTLMALLVTVGTFRGPGDLLPPAAGAGAAADPGAGAVRAALAEPAGRPAGQPPARAAEPGQRRCGRQRPRAARGGGVRPGAQPAGQAGAAQPAPDAGRTWPTIRGAAWSRPARRRWSRWAW